MTRRESIKKAQGHIERGTDLAYDVAVSNGQMLANVKHMVWFIKAVAFEINPEAFPEMKGEI